MLALKHFQFQAFLGLLFILLLSFLPSSYSQKRSFGTLPLMQTDEIIGDASEDLNDTQDYEHLVSIYNRLVEARGDLRYRVPQLFLRSQEGNAAYIDYGSLNITLEKKAYDVAKEIGDDAVAYLLAHELTHYYEKHAWKNQFVRENSDLVIGKNLSKIDDDIIYETEADYLGGFLSYSAGYGLFDKGEQVINRLYEAYGMKDNMPNYPTRSERIELYKRSTKKLESLVDAFDMANYLLTAGRYNEAYKFYDYILKYYQSRELYNNLGVAATLGAMELFKSTDLKYKYVTELDVSFKGSKNVLSVKKKRESILRQAIYQFNTAITLDPNYAPAYLNKANAYALLKEWSKAEFYLLEEALPIATKNREKYPKTLVDIEILHGIIAANTGEQDLAKQKFEAAAALGSRLAQENLKIHNGNPPIADIKPAESVDDRFGTMTLNAFFRDLLVDENNIVKLEDTYTFFQSIPNEEDFKVYFSMSEGDDSVGTAFLFTTEKANYKTKKGVGIGDSPEAIIAQYGEPNNKLETTLGQYWVYANRIFILENNILKRFINYDTRTIE